MRDSKPIHQQFIPGIILAICLLVSPHGAACETLSSITTASPSWNTFTNEDGTGLYHDIIKAVYSPRNIRVTHKYTNAKRGLYMIRQQLADIYTCKVMIDEFSDLILGKYPMYEGQFYALFKKDTVKHWQGKSAMAGHRVVWRRGYYKASELDIDIRVIEADSGPSALGQVVLDRAVFYIDDLTLIRQSIAEGRHKFPPDAFRIEPVGRRSYRPVFKRSERGKMLMEIYNRGIETLHRSGELKKIFNTWGHTYPAYDIP
ncbi:MAG: transporter substrate-binding domain-containing protein [Desulfobacterales bacterium]|nr:transporter substrate-binding domain-containing protein [Desulfobacterales bacterium]